MVWWVPAAVSAASAIGGAIGRYQGKKKRKKQYRAIEEAGGLANYAPEYGAARDAIGPQTEGPGGFYANLLNNFMGRPEDMEIALQRTKPFVAGSLANTQAFRDLQNYQERAAQLPQEREYMQAYGAQASRLAGASNRAGAASRGALNRSGLGNSAAMAALAGQQQQALAGQQGDLFTRMYQAGLSQRMQNAQMQQQWMSTAYDAHRDIAAMSLGASPVPRAPAEKTNLWGPIAQMAGTALGNYLAGSGSANPQLGSSPKGDFIGPQQ